VFSSTCDEHVGVHDQVRKWLVKVAVQGSGLREGRLACMVGEEGHNVNVRLAARSREPERSLRRLNIVAGVKRQSKEGQKSVVRPDKFMD